MIYFSQLQLNPRSRMVQKELGDPYQLHRTVMRGFSVPREQANVLHRIDEWPHAGLVLVVQSTVAPDWQPLLSVGQGGYLRDGGGVGFRPKSFTDTLPAGSTYRFRLRANPTVSKRRDGQKNSNRVPLVREEKQIEWLHKKGVHHGFKLLQVNVGQSDEQRANIHRDKQPSHRLAVTAVQFDGVLQVNDDEAFNQAWQTGIGPAKAFGCGLLSLAPA